MYRLLYRVVTRVANETYDYCCLKQIKCLLGVVRWSIISIFRPSILLRILFIVINLIQNDVASRAAHMEMCVSGCLDHPYA